MQFPRVKLRLHKKTLEKWSSSIFHNILFLLNLTMETGLPGYTEDPSRMIAMVIVHSYITDAKIPLTMFEISRCLFGKKSYLLPHCHCCETILATRWWRCNLLQCKVEGGTDCSPGWARIRSGIEMLITAKLLTNWLFCSIHSCWKHFLMSKQL